MSVLPEEPEDEVRADPARIDAARAEAAVRELLIAVGEDPDRPGLRDTPARVARAYAETFAGIWQDPAEILATVFDEDHDELVLVKDIPMYSTCEHHLVPFHGAAHVGYIPGEDGRVTGLSRNMPRTAEVTVVDPGLRMPRMPMHRCSASTTTMTPRGSRCSSRASAICRVIRSCTCGRRA